MLKLSVQRKHTTQCFHPMTWFLPWNPKPRLFSCCGRWSWRYEKAQPQGGGGQSWLYSFLGRVSLGWTMAVSKVPETWGADVQFTSKTLCWTVFPGRLIPGWCSIPGQCSVLTAQQFFSALLPTTPKSFQVTFKRLNQCSKHIGPNQVVFDKMKHNYIIKECYFKSFSYAPSFPVGVCTLS